jgi:hypothetical protein
MKNVYVTQPYASISGEWRCKYTHSNFINTDNIKWPSIAASTPVETANTQWRVCLMDNTNILGKVVNWKFQHLYRGSNIIFLVYSAFHRMLCYRSLQKYKTYKNY